VVTVDCTISEISHYYYDRASGKRYPALVKYNDAKIVEIKVMDGDDIHMGGPWKAGLGTQRGDKVEVPILRMDE
jgi:hypothetical protein